MTRRTPWLALGCMVVGSALSFGALALDCPPNSTDPKCKEQLRQEQLRQQQQAQQKAQHEAQQRALQQQQQQQKAQQEAQQKALQQQQQKAQQEAQQKAMQQKAQQEAQQKAQQEAQQRAQHDAQMKAQQQKAQQEAQQKGAQQKAQQEAQQKAAQQKAQHEAQQKAQQQKAQQEAQQKGQPPKAQQAQPARPVQPQQQQQQAQPARQPAQQQPQQTVRPTAPQPQPQPQPTKTQQTPTPQPPPVHAQPRNAPTSPAVAQQPSPPTRTTAQPAAPVAPTAKSTYQPATMTPTGRSLYHPPANTAKSAPTAAPIAAAPRVAISATTAVVPRSDKSGYVIQHQAKDGSQVVVTQRKLATGTVQAVAYKESADVRLGTSTRVYSDGHRVVVGRDYQSHSLYGGPTYVTYKTGLRSAMLPTGKPIFRESFTTVRAPDGHDVKVIQKTVYVNHVYGRPVVLATPVVRVYEETIVYGRPAYFYRPAYYAPVFYRTFWVPLATPLVVNDGCAMCPSHAVAFASPPARYDNPVDLVGDLQLSSAFEEAAVRSDADAPQYADVRNQMSELTRNVSARIETDPSLKQQVGGAGPDLQKVNQAMNELAPVQVPDEVRQQVRAQVRLAIAQLQNQHPAIVSDVVKSGYAKIFLFQTGAPLNVSDATTGEECFINTGDLIGFATVPSGESPVAQMRVVTSGAQSCQAKQVVNVPLTDLQDMLNGFAERVEDNLKRVNLCVSTPGACTRT